MDLISSLNNPKIKQVRSLKRRKARQASGLYAVEGIFHVGEAVQASEDGRTKLAAIYYAPEILSSDYAQSLIDNRIAQGLPCYATTTAVFQSIAEKENPQGILAVLQANSCNLSEISPENYPWGIALIAPQDPGNVGTVLRTIDAVGADALLLLEHSVDTFHSGVVRASMGTLFWYPVVRASYNDFVEWAKYHGYHVYGTSAKHGTDYRQVVEYKRPLILLMGSEREGLSPAQAAECEMIVRIPMQGRTTSLNLAVATGVVSYAIMDKLV